MKIKNILTLFVPWMIIGGLLYAGLFLKPKPVGKTITPQPIEQRDNFYGITAPATTVIWAVGGYGKIVRSDNSGNTWIVQNSHVSAHLQSIAAWDEMRAVAVGNRGIILVTANGGETWEKSEAPLSNVANKLLRVRVFGDGSAWAVGEMGALLSTTDYGVTWKRAIQEEDIAWNDTFFVGRRGWVVGEFGRIKVTNNHGESWEDVNSPVKTSLTSVFFKNESEGVAVGLEGTILFTKDGGKFWTAATNVTNEHLFSVLWDGKSWLAVGDKGTLLASSIYSGPWTNTRTSSTDSSWYTEIISRGGTYYLAGANLCQLKDHNLHSFKKLADKT